MSSSTKIVSSSYSVVMAVYRDDNLNWFEQAVRTILNQTLVSDDIIIVRDGSVSADMEKVLKRYESFYEKISIVRLESNVGAGQARNEGVKRARNELIAIMDADDLSLKNRFELQVDEFHRNPNLALVGGQMSEFEGSSDNIVGYRMVPVIESKIKKFARYRSPVNHVTIMFKKSVFNKIGGYPKMNRAEDYYMVSALLVNGYTIGNIGSTIVNCRIGSENIQRRKKWNNVRENIIARWKIYKLGAVSILNFLISSLAQILIFIMPTSLLNSFFATVLRSRRG